jgi:hypothetical protein
MSRDPRKRFFLAIAVGNSDGTMESRDALGAFDSAEEATDALLDDANENGTLDAYVYEVEPIIRVYRGKPKAKRLRP